LALREAEQVISLSHWGMFERTTLIELWLAIDTFVAKYPEYAS